MKLYKLSTLLLTVLSIETAAFAQTTGQALAQNITGIRDDENLVLSIGSSSCRDITDGVGGCEFQIRIRVAQWGGESLSESARRAAVPVLRTEEFPLSAKESVPSEGDVYKIYKISGKKLNQILSSFKRSSNEAGVDNGFGLIIELYEQDTVVHDFVTFLAVPFGRPDGASLRASLWEKTPLRDGESSTFRLTTIPKWDDRDWTQSNNVTKVDVSFRIESPKSHGDDLRSAARDAAGLETSIEEVTRVKCPYCSNTSYISNRDMGQILSSKTTDAAIEGQTSPKAAAREAK